MKTKASFLLAYTLFLSCVMTSCSSQTKQPDIPVFKNMKMFMTQKQFNSFADSLVSNDPAFKKSIHKNNYYCEFTEKSEFGVVYNGYVLPTFNNGIMTKLTIFYTPFSSPESVTKYAGRKERILMYWGDNVNKVQNDINLKLQIKYGLPVKTGRTISAHPEADYTFLFQEWRKGDLMVKLLQEVEKDDGSNRFSFCNYLVEYTPTDEFLKKNHQIMDEAVKSSSIY